MTIFAICFGNLLYALATVATLVIGLGLPLLGFKRLYDIFLQREHKKAAAQREHEQHLQRMETAIYKKEFFKEIA